MVKTYFYKKNDLTTKAVGILGMDLDKINAMTFENLEGENLTQEELREKYIQDNHYKSYVTTDYLLSKTFYEYPKILDGEIVGKTDEERKIEGSLKLADNEIIENGVLLVLTDDEMKIRGLKKLADGEYIDTTGLSDVLVRVDVPVNTVKPSWNKTTNTWDETATSKEIDQFYYDNITPITTYVLESGFEYNGYIQRSNDHIDKTLDILIADLEEQIKLTGNENLTEGWSFDDAGRSSAVFNLAQLKDLRAKGVQFFKATASARGYFIQARVMPTLDQYLQVLQTFTDKSSLNDVDTSNIQIGV